MDYLNVTSIIPAAERDALREMVEALGIEGAVGLWSVPMSMDGQLPATHYGCSGWMHAELVDLLPGYVVVAEDAPVFFDPDGQPPAPPPPGPIVITPEEPTP